MVYIGIDLGGTGIKVGVVSESGQILGRSEAPTLAHRPWRQIVQDMGQNAMRALVQSGYTKEDVAAIGVGVPGIGDNVKGLVIASSNLGWENIPLREELQTYLAKPVAIDNDATVAGFAESVCGVSAGCQSSVFMTLGTGVGGGIVLDGKPWSGFHGVGSEIGHIPMDIGGEPCACGNFGCLEQYCSASAIIRMGKQIALQHPDSLLYDECGGDLNRLNAKMVFDAAKELDAAAMKVFDRYVDYLCRAIYTITTFLDPEMIVLGGGVSKSGSFLLDAVHKRIPRYLLFKTLPYPRIEIARLGADAGMIGAAMLGRHLDTTTSGHTAAAR